MTTQPPDKFSLGQEVKKRKTQELLRTIEAKRTGQLLPPVSPPPTLPAAEPTPRVTALSGPLPTPPLSRQQRRLIAVVSLLLIVVVCLGTLVVARPDTIAPAAATWPPLPTVSASSAVSYLKRVGVTPTNLRSLTVPDTTWQAKQGVQFEVYQDQVKGVFILLSYDSPPLASADLFKTSHITRFQQWQVAQVGNMLVLASPDTEPSLRTTIASHLTQYAVVPSRGFMATKVAG